MAPLLRGARGAKSVEHLEVLRQSDPCYGSLAPSQDRASVHEVSYDPLKRYVAMAPLLRGARGAKSVEHLEVLRQSDPCYGSLAPSQERQGKHELSYAPCARFVALAKSLRVPR